MIYDWEMELHLEDAQRGLMEGIVREADRLAIEMGDSAGSIETLGLLPLLAFDLEVRFVELRESGGELLPYDQTVVDAMLLDIGRKESSHVD